MECKADHVSEVVRLVLLQLPYYFMRKNSKKRFTYLNAFMM